jgi:hypothetical protein
MTKAKKEELEHLKNEVLRMARGRWGAILGTLAPPLQAALDRAGRHVPCPVHGGKDGFRVFRDVDDTGGTVCNTCGIHADGFATLMWANGWNFSTTLRAVADYLRMGGTSMTPVHGVRPESVKSEDDERVRQSLNRVWNESIAMSDRDAEPARLYLARRGISISPPKSLRFHPSLPYYDGTRKIGEYPAILAKVIGADGNPVTIHRTYLTSDGKKAPVESPRKLMTYPKDRKIVGGTIRLTTETDIRVMAVAEGLETSLAVMEGTGLPVWCAVNALLLENLVPPSAVERVLVFADKDRHTEQHPKGHGQEAARRLVQRLWEKGIQASAIVPAGDIPAGQKSLDWLDILNRDGKTGFPSIESIDACLLRRAA